MENEKIFWTSEIGLFDMIVLFVPEFIFYSLISSLLLNLFLNGRQESYGIFRGIDFASFAAALIIASLITILGIIKILNTKRETVEVTESGINIKSKNRFLPWRDVKALYPQGNQSFGTHASWRTQALQKTSLFGDFSKDLIYMITKNDEVIQLKAAFIANADEYKLEKLGKKFITTAG